MMERFVSVTRATLKGTLFIGLIQGVLGGVIFAVLGISGAVLWGGG
jgi:predicted PurR-regulated permease PerM